MEELKMWQYNYTNELYHHGVIGMKWGKRGSSLKEYGSATGKLLKNDIKHPIAVNKANSESIRATKGIGSKVRRSMVYQKTNEINDINKRTEKIVNDKKQLKEGIATKIKKVNEEKAINKEKINKQYDSLNKNTKLNERLVYNDATRKKAAKYIVNNNMTVKEATYKANSDARRNTAMIVTAIGVVTVASLLNK